MKVLNEVGIYWNLHTDSFIAGKIWFNIGNAGYFYKWHALVDAYCSEEPHEINIEDIEIEKEETRKGCFWGNKIDVSYPEEKIRFMIWDFLCKGNGQAFSDRYRVIYNLPNISLITESNNGI